MQRLSLVRGLAAGALALAAGCNSSAMEPGPAAQLVSVSPRGGSTSVTASADIVLTFNQGMMAGMEQFMALHQGGVTGPTQPMNCVWSDGQRTLTCHPGQPLAAGTRYTIHVGGGMMDSSGQSVGMEQFMALHQGGVTGPTQPMNCSWSDGQRTLTCHPGQPLAAGTRYTIHVGGGMMDSSGQSVGMERYGMGMGGQWATSGMMGGQTGMMGTGWMTANGSYGMMFEFTTR